MAFTRSAASVQAVDLSALPPIEVERRIIQGVRRFATRQDNWASADKNTPFLGTITGMGIESANLVDITMAMERQFLTRKTKRVFEEGGATVIRLDDGELGPLMILDGQDTFAATPGLAVKMLMDLGHMPHDPEYLTDVISFAHVVVIGEAYRAHDGLKRALSKIERGADPTSGEVARESLKGLVEQAARYMEATTDPEALARAREEAHLNEKRSVDLLRAELAALEAQARQASDAVEVDALKSKMYALRLRMSKSALLLRVAEQVAREAGERTPLEQTKLDEVRRVVAATIEDAERVLTSTDAAGVHRQ